MKLLIFFGLILSLSMTKISGVKVSSDQKTIEVFGKKFDGKKYCNEATLINPDLLDAYKIESGAYTIAVHCPASLDEETNVVSVFGEKAEPKAKEVTPPSSSNRITDKQLRETISVLTKK